MNANAKPARNATYDLFILALSVLSIVNLALILLIRRGVVESVVLTIDLFLSAIFFADFLYRLWRAQSKWRYILREFGWADLLSSLPLIHFNILRVFSILRIVHLLRLRGYGRRQLRRDLAQDRAASTLLLVLLLMIVLMEVGGVAITFVEADHPGANIKSGSDAIWWIMVTVTTVGYGDKYPVTDAGRLIGMLVMLFGVGVFGVFSGFLVNYFLSAKPLAEPSAQSGEQHINAKLAELRRLIEAQESAQAELKAKLSEIEKLA